LVICILRREEGKEGGKKEEGKEGKYVLYKNICKDIILSIPCLFLPKMCNL